MPLTKLRVLRCLSDDRILDDGAAEVVDHRSDGENSTQSFVQSGFSHIGSPPSRLGKTGPDDCPSRGYTGDEPGRFMPKVADQAASISPSSRTTHRRESGCNVSKSTMSAHARAGWFRVPSNCMAIASRLPGRGSGCGGGERLPQT